ncbi:MAG: hypothetical protein ACFCUT_03735 [Kiloniellaceae bacterium]
MGFDAEDETYGLRQRLKVARENLSVLRRQPRELEKEKAGIQRQIDEVNKQIATWEQEEQEATAELGAARAK